MVRPDQVDVAGGQRRPEGSARVSIAQGRCTLADGAKPLDIFFTECEVMRTRLDRDIHAASACLDRHRNATSAADVHDVQLRARLTRKVCGALDRIYLGLNGPRTQPVDRCAGLSV